MHDDASLTELNMHGCHTVCPDDGFARPAAGAAASAPVTKTTAKTKTTKV